MRYNTQNLMFRQIIFAQDAAQTESPEASRLFSASLRKGAYVLLETH